MRTGIRKFVTNAVKGMKSIAQRACMFLLNMMMSFVAFAQNGAAGQGAIAQVTTEIKAYIPMVQNLIYAIAGVVVLGGAISVFIKMNNEEQDVKKSIMLIVGSCIFLIAAAQALPLFFE